MYVHHTFMFYIVATGNIYIIPPSQPHFLDLGYDKKNPQPNGRGFLHMHGAIT
jgi:hypothetical protein